MNIYAIFAVLALTFTINGACLSQEVEEQVKEEVSLPEKSPKDNETLNSLENRNPQGPDVNNSRVDNEVERQSNTTSKPENFSRNVQLEFGALYNFQFAGYFPNTILTDTDTNETATESFELDGESGLGFTLRLKKKFHRRTFWFLDIEHNRPIEIEKIKASDFSVKTEGLELSLNIITVGFSLDFKKLILSAGLSAFTLDIDSGDSEDYDVEPGAGVHLGAGLKINTKNTVYIEAKSLSTEVVVTDDNIEIDFGSGRLSKLSLVYRHNFGDLRDLF